MKILMMNNDFDDVGEGDDDYGHDGDDENGDDENYDNDDGDYENRDNDEEYDDDEDEVFCLLRRQSAFTFGQRRLLPLSSAASIPTTNTIRIIIIDNNEVII